MESWIAFLVGAATIIVFLAVVEAMARIWHAKFLTSIILGSDKRASTSKTFVLMWTLLVAWALVTMLIVGVFINTRACAGGTKYADAITACKVAHDQVGLLQIGWKQFIASGLSNAYLALLGIPVVAAVAAQAITQSKVDAGTVVKTTNPDDNKGIGPRLLQIFSADDDTTDIGDFQYVVFNLITAAFFVAGFLRVTGQGLPTIPDTLLGLTGVSAAAYAGKKAATRTQPTITGVFPSMLRQGQSFTVSGNGLTVDPAAPVPPGGLVSPEITVNGVQAPTVATVGDNLTATVPAGLIAAPAVQPIAGKVQVKNAYGAITPDFDVQCL